MINMNANAERAARTAVNNILHALGTVYHNGLPVGVIDDALQSYGFTGLDEGIYCGRDGQVHEQVGSRTWISFTWHKMESGRYEVVAYLS